MNKIIILFILISIYAFPAFAWNGKVIAVNEPNVLTILADNTAVPVKLDNLIIPKDVTKEQALVEISSIALDKQVNVIEKVESNKTINSVLIDGTPISTLFHDLHSNNIKTTLPNITPNVAEPTNIAPLETQTNSTDTQNINLTEYNITKALEKAKKQPPVTLNYSYNIKKNTPFKVIDNSDIGLWP